MLVVKNLYVKYPETTEYALKNISFSSTPGELVLIAGPSGSGKTTLARAIAGFIPSFYKAEISGEIKLFNRDPISEGISSLRGIVGFVGQNPEMFVTSLTVFEEIALPLINLGYPKEYILKRVKEVARDLGICDLLDRLTLELSAGQLQKVSIASALALNPKVLVLDEPLARLDKISSRFISSLLKKIAKKSKIVLVFEHHLDEILPLADKVIVLNRGKKMCEGTPREVVKHLLNIDVPEITEAFYLAGFKNLPISVMEAVKHYDSIKKRLV